VYLILLTSRRSSPGSDRGSEGSGLFGLGLTAETNLVRGLMDGVRAVLSVGWDGELIGSDEICSLGSS
jgi:hypothetical protein